MFKPLCLEKWKLIHPAGTHSMPLVEIRRCTESPEVISIQYSTVAEKTSVRGVVNRVTVRVREVELQVADCTAQLRLQGIVGRGCAVIQTSDVPVTRDGPKWIRII